MRRVRTLAHMHAPAAAPAAESGTFLKAKDVALALGVSVRTVQTLIAAGELPGVPVGRHHAICVRDEDVAAYKERRDAKIAKFYAGLHPVQIAARLGMEVREVYALVAAGELAAVRIGRMIRVGADDLAEYEARPRARA